MRIGSAFPSTYLKASDIPEGQPVNVRIDRVEIEDVGGGRGKKEEKPVLYFVNKEKGMVLNKTNSNTIAKAYGDETDDWAGKPIQIVSTETEFQGDMVACLRIKIPKGGAAAPAASNGGGQGAPVSRREEIRNRPPAPSPVSEESQFNDDDIPF